MHSIKKPMNQLCHPWQRQSMAPMTLLTSPDPINWSLQHSASNQHNSEPHWKQEQQQHPPQFLPNHKPRDLHLHPFRSQPSGPPISPPASVASDPPRGNRSTRFFTNMNCCWSHGFDIGNNHTSATCRNPKEGHKREATVTNQMGGDQTNCHLIPN